MRVKLKINNNGTYEEVPLYNTFTMDERLDEELDSGAGETYLKSGEEIAEFTESIIVLDDGETTLETPFFAFDDVQKRAKDYYGHLLELVEPTRWLMGITIDGLKVTQPIDETATKKTLLDTLKRVLTCFKTFRYNEVWNYDEYILPMFQIDEETANMLSEIISPEFEWQSQTLLFEVLQDIADVVDCIPRLKNQTSSLPQFLTVKFDKINDIPQEFEL